MSDIDDEINEYLDLPDDPEMAFTTLHQRLFTDLERILESDQSSTWEHERRYVDSLIAFDEVHNLDMFSDYGSPPNNDGEFYIFYQKIRRHANKSSIKIKMEAARRLKIVTESVIVLDASARQAIHALINAVKEKLYELTLPENKRESLFNKLNQFAAEVDRNRTRTEAFYSFAVDTARSAREVADELKPLQTTIDRVFDLIEKATKLNESFPPWKERMKIEGPTKRLAAPQQDDD